MSVKYGKFEMPEEVILDEDTASYTFGRFIAEPLEKGFAYTFGNALRRLLLSSIESPAIISITMEGVPLEYMAIDGVIEDMTNIILNLKGALLRRLPTTDSPGSREQRMLTTVLEIDREMLDKNQGQYKVTLKDLIKDSFFEVVNPDLYLFTVTAPMKKQIDLRVAFGRGYVPSERLLIWGKTTDEIMIDAAFSPVKQVNSYVENTRVGQDTDYDRLILEIKTDGRITPSEALTFATQICLKHFEVFNKVKSLQLAFDEGYDENDADHEELIAKLCLKINEIELSVRSTNCLSGANIETIAELVSIPERRMLEFRNFGKKSLNEIKAKLHEMGLYLGMDILKYGINPDNVKEEINKIIETRKSAELAAAVEE
jgi:DNA-directed RNA polymerase subunit alpha